MQKTFMRARSGTGDESRDRRQRRDPGGRRSVRCWPISANCPATIRSCRSTSRRATSPPSSTASRSSTSPRPSPSSRSASATSSRSTPATSTCATSCSTAASWWSTCPRWRTPTPRLAALGKLVVASLRGMMAQLLGASLEGDYTEADKPGMGPAPFPVVFDELAYYATSGLDRMLAMGRGLNISFMLGFQEVVGHLGAARREDRLAARQRQPDHRHAPAGLRPHPRVDREDRRPDLHHPGHRPITAPATAIIARRGTPRSGRSRASIGTI